jgi:hypothetical protein
MTGEEKSIKYMKKEFFYKNNTKINDELLHDFLYNNFGSGKTDKRGVPFPSIEEKEFITQIMIQYFKYFDSKIYVRFNIWIESSSEKPHLHMMLFEENEIKLYNRKMKIKKIYEKSCRV